MYSVVMMLAIGGAADLPDRGCCGCSCSCSCSCRGGHGRSKCNCSCSCSCGGRHSRKCHGCNSCHGCNGCSGYYGCNGCQGYVVACNGGCTGGAIVVPGAAPAPKKTAPGKTEVEAPATVVVSLPADARLTIDGNATTSTTESRTFTTPSLPTGEQFSYTLRAEIVRDGRTIAETQQINVRGGEQTVVNFNFSSTGVALAR